MCGVIAVVGDDGRLSSTGVEKLKHRGIRSKTVEASGSSIGHARLPIVGVGDENDQPRVAGNWLIGFVGEILDFRDRCPTMECDLDLVAKTWVEKGPTGFCGFDGFWSVVAIDRCNGDVHALTDYLSQKPLYVRDDAWALAVASELDALASLGPTDLDEVYLSAVVKWGYCPDPARTPYRFVTKVRPGEHVVLKKYEPMRREIVDELRPSKGDLRFEIEEAVRRRVTSSDVPVACLVSGGLDSSIAWTLAQRYGDVRPYHVENGEWDRCSMVAPDARSLDCDGVTMEKGLDYMQEPVDLGSLLPQVALSDAIAGCGGERVCLTGDGADELFGGYERATRYDSQASDVWQELVSWHLPRLDRVMMRNRVEVRSPFLSRRVASIALGLPRSERTDKKILRELFSGVLPRGIIDAPKRPLRTVCVGTDRETNSRRLVELFREGHERLNQER